MLFYSFCILIEVFRPQIFNAIICVVRFRSTILLLVYCLSPLLFVILFPSACFLKIRVFLVFYFNWLLVYILFYFLVVALWIIIYTSVIFCILVGVNIVPFHIKYKNLATIQVSSPHFLGTLFCYI